MIVIEEASSFSQTHGRCVATIGKFDGIHLGHQLILDQLQRQAREKELPALVILIEPHPEEFFAGPAGDCPARLMDKQEKLRLLEEFGIDFTFVLRFDEEMSRTSAGDYIRDILVQGLGVAALIAGEDFRFGHKREGDFALLQRQGRECDFAVIKTLVREHEGLRISSTLVRRTLALGDFELVEQLLGCPYAIRGEVTRGQQLGEQLGYPTCNIELHRQRIPLHGIYACEVKLDEGSYQAAASIGYRPTVSDAREPVLEAYILDFEGNLYGKSIEVVFRKKIRDEEKFASLDELKRQIGIDVERIKEFFAGAANRGSRRI